MYNRYIPQSDGSYQRNHVKETSNPVPNRKPPQQTPVPPPPPPPPPPPLPPSPSHHRPEPVGGFLRQLLPQHFDTADLIIVLLLLLLSGDSEEDRNTAMLTLALYLFM